MAGSLYSWYYYSGLVGCWVGVDSFDRLALLNILLEICW